MGLLRFLFILLMVYLFFKVFSRIILPLLLKLTVRRVQNKFYEQNPHMRPDEPLKEGKITIKKVSEDKNREVPSDIGEYVDYEEIK